MGFNHYFVLKLNDQSSALGDQILSLRSELALFGQSEIALTYAGQSKGRNRFGFDLSSALGPIDIYLESAWTSHRLWTQYEGDFDLSTGKMPTVKSLDEGGYAAQIVGGLSWNFKYNDDDSMATGIEYFDNGIGYDSASLELYSFLNGASQPLYVGRRYAAAYLRLPQPLSFNKTSITISALSNLSDKSTSERLSASFDLGTATSFEVFASACQGSPGELCFAVRPELKAAAEKTILDERLNATIASLATSPTSFQTGVGLTIGF